MWSVRPASNAMNQRRKAVELIRRQLGHSLGDFFHFHVPTVYHLGLVKRWNAIRSPQPPPIMVSGLILVGNNSNRHYSGQRIFRPRHPLVDHTGCLNAFLSAKANPLRSGERGS